MLAINVDNLNNLTVIECRGRILRDESVSQLRDAVLSQTRAMAIMLDLSDVLAISGSGLRTLTFLNHWARQQDIEFKLYSPSKAVVEGLSQNGSLYDFEIVNFHALQLMLQAMMHTDNHRPLAA
jgi:anti-anti-sigma regulatory factor